MLHSPHALTLHSTQLPSSSGPSPKCFHITSLPPACGCNLQLFLLPHFQSLPSGTHITRLLDCFIFSHRFWKLGFVPTPNRPLHPASFTYTSFSLSVSVWMISIDLSQIHWFFPQLCLLIQKPIKGIHLCYHGLFLAFPFDFIAVSTPLLKVPMCLCKLPTFLH